MFEKDVRPMTGQQAAVTTIHPKTLRPVEAAVVAPYDPTVFSPPDAMQDITVYPPPLWIMSPRIRVYRAADICRFRGYLRSCVPVGMPESEQPEMVLTFEVADGD